MPDPKPPTVFDLIVTLKSLISRTVVFHQGGVDRANEALSLLKQVERQFGFPTTSELVLAPQAPKVAPAPKLPPSANKSKSTKKHSKKKASPVRQLIEKQAKVPPKAKQPEGAPAKVGVPSGPKLGGSAAVARPRMQLSPIETKLFKALTGGKSVCIAELKKVRGLTPQRIHTGIYRLRQKGYKIVCSYDGYTIEK